MPLGVSPSTTETSQFLQVFENGVVGLDANRVKNTGFSPASPSSPNSSHLRPLNVGDVVTLS